MTRILYFGIARDLAGMDSEEVRLDPNASIDNLWKVLIELHPRLSGIRDSSRVAVDLKYATDATLLGDGVEVAIVPPVAGG